MEPTPEALFGEIASYIEKAHGILESGEWVDLRDMDKDVEALCLSVAALSPGQAKEYMPELEYLREQIEGLEALMLTKRDAIKDELQGAHTIERANKAYAHGQALRTPKDDES